MSSSPVIRNSHWLLREVHWPRPLDAARSLTAAEAWAADQVSPYLLLETRSDGGVIRSLVGMHVKHSDMALRRLRSAVPGVQLTELSTDRTPVTAAGQLRLSTRHRPLRTEQVDAITRQLYGVLADVHGDEAVVVQLLLGARRMPLSVATGARASLVAPWYRTAWFGDDAALDGEKRSALRDKVGLHGFTAVVRIGVAGASKERRRALLLSAFAALRIGESAGLQAHLTRQRPNSINSISLPLWWRLRLNAAEVVAWSGWPVGETNLPGLPPLHPVQVAPTRLAGSGDLILADALAPGVHGQLGYGLDDAMRHTWVLGPNGVGKSTLLLNRIQQDLWAGRAVVVIEPKDLVADILARVPATRLDDVVLLDPSDRGAAVGINPLHAHGRHPELVAGSLLATFRALYDDQLGPRSTDVLANCLLVLARHPSASLAMIGPLLTNTGFRRSLVGAAVRADPITAGPFWAWYEALSPEARSQVIAPLQNKLRPLLQPQLRAVLGQRSPRFNVRDVLDHGKVLLVPLQPGLIGPEAAELLAAVIVAELWMAIRERVGIPEGKRRPVMIYIDEVQQYLRTPVDLGDALATSRSLRASWTLAHQFRAQLPAAMLAAFDGNVRNRVAFQLSAHDARAMATGQTILSPEDFTTLPAFHVYAQLIRGNSLQPWASGISLAPPPTCSDPAAIRAASRARYARPLDEVEAGFLDLITTSAASGGDGDVTGRRRK